jgi:hypothetical protein
MKLYYTHVSAAAPEARYGAAHTDSGLKSSLRNGRFLLSFMHWCVREQAGEKNIWTRKAIRYRIMEKNA